MRNIHTPHKYGARDRIPTVWTFALDGTCSNESTDVRTCLETQEGSWQLPAPPGLVLFWVLPQDYFALPLFCFRNKYFFIFNNYVMLHINYDTNFESKFTYKIVVPVLLLLLATSIISISSRCIQRGKNREVKYFPHCPLFLGIPKLNIMPKEYAAEKKAERNTCSPTCTNKNTCRGICQENTEYRGKCRLPRIPRNGGQ